MSDAADPEEGVPPPPAATLEALPSDVWAALLPHVRAGLQQLEEQDSTKVVRRLRAAPTGRLAGGRVRRELCELLARPGPPWEAVLEQLRTAPELPPELVAIAGGASLDTFAADEHLGSGRPRGAPAPGGTAATDEADLRRAREEAERARGRLRRTRDERDAARRRAEGAERRAAAAEAELGRLRAELAALGTERAELQRTLQDAEVARRRAVEREARRRDAEVERLRSELAAVRRTEEEQRLAVRRDRARRQAARVARESTAEARREAGAERGSRVRPGRPSVLPEGVVSDTAEAVDALLHAGRLVLVDGYNLTLQHRGHLPLETQRTWLIQLLATLAAKRRVRPVVVFDGERAGSGRPRAGSREVEVRFTPSGITADDELVLAVEATDEPVLVVTDDGELRARVQASGADVVGTAPFLWAAG